MSKVSLLCKTWAWPKECSCGSRGTKLSLARDSCWEHSWANSAANATTLIPPVETKKGQTWLWSYQTHGVWDLKTFLGHVVEWAKDVPGCLWHLFLPQSPPGAMSSKNKENTLCIVPSLFMTTPWSYWIVLDLFQCQGSFADLDSRGALGLETTTMCQSTKWTGILSPAYQGSIHTGSQGGWPNSLSFFLCQDRDWKGLTGPFQI